jgi:hypothetical protein
MLPACFPSDLGAARFAPPVDWLRPATMPNPVGPVRCRPCRCRTSPTPVSRPVGWDGWDGTGAGCIQAWRRGARDDCRHPRLLLSPGWCWAAGRLCAPLPSSALPCPTYHPSAPPPAAGLHSARSLQAALCHGQSALLRDEPVSHRRSQLLALQRFTAPVLSVLGAMAAFVAYPVPRAGPVFAQSRARPWPSTTPPSSSHPVGPRRRFSSPRTAVHRPPLHLLLAHDGCPLTPALTTTTTLPSGLRRPKSAFSRWPAL